MSKSMFNTGSFHTNKRTMVNPLGENPFSNGANLDAHVDTFSKIEQKYTRFLSEKNFDQIPADIIEYSNLYDKIQKMVLHSSDKKMQLLFTISLHGLMGAIHAFHLNTQNVQLQLKTLSLQNRVETILTDKNSRDVMNASSSSTESLSLVKTVTLAPLYSYYILLFGVPENGFDPVKIQEILQVLLQYNVDPYQ